MELLGEQQALESALADRYRFVREIGRGGSGVVFLADDLANNRQVAIKILRVELAGSHARRRFLREIEFTTQLNHPNIVTLFESGEHDGILYYLMPYVAGEALQQRLRRERQLPIPDALRIGRAVSAALTHAHSAGIVHRDIKPGNILLDGESVLVADFGIARAILRTLSEHSISSPGVGVGTPAYMSPEQATGDSELDGRSDIYSLGCVIYEMLSGTVPFTGPSPTAITARHAMDPVPPLSTVRRSIPPHVEEAVMRALEKTPADRFATAEEFAHALGDGTTSRRTHWWMGRRAGRRGRRLIPIASALGATLLGATAYWTIAGPKAPLDARRYAVFQFERVGAVPGDLQPERQLRNALTLWDSVRVVDLRAVLPDSGDSDHTLLRRAAKQQGARWFIVGESSREGDSVMVRVTLFDTNDPQGSPRSAARRVDYASLGTYSNWVALAEDLLLSESPPSIRSLGRGTRSLDARLAFLRGQQHVREWQLVEADTQFARAARHDYYYALANLWLAQVRWWQRTPTEKWRYAAEQARARASYLDEGDRIADSALIAVASGDFANACSAWKRLTDSEPFSFASWYSSAACLKADNYVVRSRASPSGWSFRSSYADALRRYQRAFRLLPAILQADRSDSYLSVRHLFYTAPREGRLGLAVPPEHGRFMASPAWRGDSLLFIPWPESHFRNAPVQSREIADAVARQRRLFSEIVSTWATAFPSSGPALQAVAIAREMLGDASAVDTLRRARALATRLEDSVRTAAAEVWMRIKFSVPSSLTGIEQARALSDSALRWWPADSGLSDVRLESVAALLGRTSRAAALSVRAGVYPHLAPGLAASGPALLIYSSLGGPVDSIRALEARVEHAIATLVSADAREAARAEWTARAASVAFPVAPSPHLRELAGKGDYLLDAADAWMRRDTATVRSRLRELARIRRGIPPEDLTLDALYPEAWLLLQLGDVRGAVAWLDPTLNAVSRTAPQTFADPTKSAALVRSLALRAELAMRSGDVAGARRYALAVSTLWKHADDALQPLVRRMQQLAATN